MMDRRLPRATVLQPYVMCGSKQRQQRRSYGIPVQACATQTDADPATAPRSLNPSMWFGKGRLLYVRGEKKRCCTELHMLFR